MDKEVKKYIAAVNRRLNLPGKVKKRCLSDLQTTITARLEGGESWEQIKSSLGQPAEAAAELNEQMKEFARSKSPWRFLFLAIAVLSGAWLAFYAALQVFAGYLRSVGEQAGIGIIGGADGPTAIFVTTSGFDWDVAIMAVVLIVGIVGYIRLRRCKRKN